MWVELARSTDSSSDAINSATTPFEENFWSTHQKLIFLKFLIAYSITGLSYSENSNGHNSAHIWPIWMNDLPLDCLCEGLSNDVYFVSGHGSWPGSGLNYPVVARSEIFLMQSDRACGKTWKTHFTSWIYHICTPNKIVQSFRVIHHSPGHNSAEPGPIQINLVSLESWSIALQIVYLRFSNLDTS